MTWVCRCGKDIPLPLNPNGSHVHHCECGVRWLWKVRSKKYVYAGGGEGGESRTC